MCGILATSRRIVDIDHVTEFIHRRGPDLTNQIEVNGIEFAHTLLSITGNPAPQPFISGNKSVVSSYNGEIYNYRNFGDFDSDGHCILPLYEEYGFDCIQQIDGEFALVIIDFEKDILLFSTDVFSTKPLWFAKEGGDFAISSYQSCIERLGFAEPTQVEANSTYILCLSTLEIIERKDVYSFDLKQHKDNFDDWNKAFENAVAKRVQNAKHGIFIGLSSGYDSGAIACELEKQGVQFAAYSIIGSENRQIIEERLERTSNSRLIDLPLEEFLISRKHLKNYCEEYFLNIDNGEQDIVDDLQAKYADASKVLSDIDSMGQEINNSDTTEKIRNEKALLEKKIARNLEIIEYRKKGQVVTDDNGAVGLGYICSLAKKEGELIYLSGNGADEVFSDYGFGGIKHFPHSTIGGDYPKSLAEVFPWKNFFDNTQRAYLIKEEYVSGSYGIEGRYPFLDKMVVQEFLWLKQELKNSNYKSVIHQYLVGNDYPFDEQQKVGFNCGITSNMGQTGPFDNEGMYAELAMVEDAMLLPHRTVGVALDEMRFVNREREIAKLPQRKKRYNILNRFFSN